MNTKLILPAALALTFHAFLLFGMSGKTLIMAASPDPPGPKDPPPTLDPDDTIRVASNDDDTPPEPGGPVAPRPLEFPVEAPPTGAFLIPTLPSIAGDPKITRIPLDWVIPRGNRPGPDGGVIDLVGLDRVPRARLQPAPDYPFAMRSRRIEGTILVEFLVDESGNVYSPTVLRATNPGFEEAALRAVARWKFESGYKDGRKVRFRMSVPVVFRIDAS
jgi:periplasmic protein TonB